MDNPSSTHSSPRSFASDLYPQYYTPHHPHHSQTYPIPNYPTRPHHKSTLPAHPIALSVSTSTTSEHDPNEKTARPGNSYQHAQFLAGALTSSHPTDVGDSSHADYSITDTPGLSRGLSRPLTPAEQEKLAHLDRLKFFLATAPSQWDNARPTQSFAPTSGVNAYPSAASGMHPSLNRFMLPSQEFVTCVLWNGLYHITGTDIVRALVFRFEAFGRPVRNMKKFEEGVFSDLRNLKPGVDACLEEPKSPFLDLLFKYQCIRTQKKQKVFYWFSVPHDRLFLDALERDLKREKMGQEPTTHVIGEPALSFTYDPKRSLYEQFSKAQGMREEERETRKRMRQEQQRKRHLSKINGGTQASFFSNLFGLFEGSPTYKQRRKKNPNAVGALGGPSASALSRSVSSSSSASSVAAYRRGSGDDFVTMGGVDERAPGPFQYRSMEEEFGPNSRDARECAEMDAATMFQRQARRELMPADGIIPKPKVQSGQVGEVDVMISEGFSAVPVSSAGMNVGGIPPGMGGDQNVPQGFDGTQGMDGTTAVNGSFDPSSSTSSNDPSSSTSTGLGGMDMNAMNAGAGGVGGLGAGDMQMCEIEVRAGDVSEIQGGNEEEGMLLRSNVNIHPSQQFATVPSQPQPNDFTGGSQWANAPQPSPAFSHMSIPSPPPGSQHAQQHSRPGTAASAPSHKQVFDHTAMYPPGMLDSSTNSSTTASSNTPPGQHQQQPVNMAAAMAAAGGPIRRHRSMTPSLIGGSIRRPMSTVSNASSGGAPGSGGGMTTGGGNGTQASQARGYHPYGGYPTHSRNGSTHSSPAVYNVPLGSAGGGAGGETPGLRRSESRTSFAGAGVVEGEGMFRTASPGSFMSGSMHPPPVSSSTQQQRYQESPAPYTIELPPHHGHGMYGHGHANTMPVGGGYDHHQQGQGQRVDEGNSIGGAGGYHPQTHATL
ncbi:Transcription factor steA [Leucoagaricus sp. SymC.cos]|nr:Transcription factor steA [Leucoagaricus sp. SymC.cos]